MHMLMYVHVLYVEINVYFFSFSFLKKHWKISNNSDKIENEIVVPYIS